MKPLGSLTLLATMALLGFPLLTGCYTQLALNDDEPAAQVVAAEPQPPVYIVVPGPIDPPPVYYDPLPIGATGSGGGSSSSTTKTQVRNFGDAQTVPAATHTSTTPPARSGSPKRAGR